MSAPLVVNTRDGVCWTRRTVTSGGIALYAPEGIRTCPEFVMATIDELAEQGIVGSADVLPVPVAPEPQASSAERLRVERNRYRIAWRMARTRALSTGSAADRYAARARDAQDALQHMLFTVIAGQMALKAATDRVAELEDAAQKIVHLHKDSPMGPCPVCIDGDAMVRGDDYTLPYPCPTARLAGAKDCDPPSYRTADFFQPGHAYTHRPGPDSPGGPRLRFYCESVTTDKATGQPVARGWGGRRYGDRWTSVQHTRGLEDWQSGAWVDTTDDTRESESVAPVCRCDEPDADPYECEADDCSGEFSELNPFGGSTLPVEKRSAEVSLPCGCGWRTSVWHVDDGSAEEELHRHVSRVHGGTYQAQTDGA